MIKYILKRLVLSFFTLIAIIVIIYLLQAAFGINPIYHTASEGRGVTQEHLDNLSRDAGFHLNPFTRLFIYLGKLLQGNIGRAYAPNSLLELPSTFFDRLKWTVLISLPAFILSAIIGITLGILSAYKRGKFLDTMIVSLTTVMSSVPSFIFAPIVSFMAYKWFNLPFEFKTPDAELGVGIDQTILSIIPPVFVFTIISLSAYTLIVRNQMISVLSSNQVLIAKAKGLSQGTIFRKHVLRNVSLPLAAMLIPSYIGLLSGSIVMEQFFSVPGTATLFFESTKNGEIDVILFIILFFVSLTLLTKILVDVVYGLLDPRIKIASDKQMDWMGKLKKLFVRKKQVKGYLSNEKVK